MGPQQGLMEGMDAGNSPISQGRPVLKLLLNSVSSLPTFPMQVMTLNAQLAPSATKLHLSLSLER